MNSPYLRTRSFWSVAVALTLLVCLVCTTPSRAAVPTPLADKPIAAGADVPGNLALSLSVEFPTAISIANLGDYSDSTQYPGYFDPAKCYTYQYNSTTPASSYFQPSSSGLVSGGHHDCSPLPGQWSGNFMNWIATQTIDPFRWALTGGYRSVDTATQTILEKAYGSNQGSAPANFPYRGTSQGGGNNMSTSGSTIQKLTPFNTWSSFDAGIWGNGKTMVFSGGGGGSGYTLPTTSGSVIDLTSDLTTSNTSAGASGAYRVYIRVAVCDPTLGVALLEANCVQYGANYKPEGLLQQYANKIRFSAFGYLNEGGDVREGGALRAPMGFIGPNIPQPLSSVLLTNPKPEWDPITGVMSSNPDTASASASGVTQSGVMNYLNKFGEYGATTGGQVYKTFDNVSELYYASVRYFENLGNVPEWTNGASAAALDGFPAVTTWTDPILYTCQKNFILGIGDDHTWYDYDVGGNTGTGSYSPTGPSRPVPGLVASDPMNLAATWTLDLQTLEGIPLNPKWAFGLTDATYFIAGLAYGVHVNDIRPDLADTQTISTYWMDVAEGQHLENLNPYYLAAKYGGFNSPTINAANATAPFYTPANPQYDMLNTPVTLGQFDTTGATVFMNGPTYPLPDNYYNAGNANAMVASLKSAFVGIASAITQLSTVFSFSLQNVTAGAESFGANYDANGWVGTMFGFNLTFDLAGNPIQTQVWTSASTLQTQLAGTGWQTARRIATWSGSGGVAFQAANLTTAQQNALTPIYSPTLACGSASCPYLNYLRGDTTNEVASAAPTSTHSLRNRKLLLGDIVDASLTPVSTPLQTFSDANNPGYNFFKNLWTTTTPRATMVYAGANDGMLHGFDGTTGTEVFAYVPSALFQGPNGTPQVDGLVQLGNPSYVHHYYVDATPAAFDIDMSRTEGFTGAVNYATAGGTPWRSVLIGGLGKGGKSFYAIDITNPAAMTTESAVAGDVLWEFTDSTMGYSFGTPVVVKTVKYGWVAILTSGYDNPDGFGYLYIVNPRTGALLEKIQTPSPSIGLTQASAFVKDFSDETTDSVYVGDLNGQVWRYDLTGTTGLYPQPVLLATVTDASGVAQPITTAPLIEIHPVTRKRYVLFGTGVLLAITDVPDSQMQSFYAIIDGTASGFNPITAPITRANLTPITNSQLSSTIPNPILFSGPQGWYTDLGIDATSNVGWRVVIDPSAFNGIVIFATNLTTATDPCNPKGSGRIYAIDYATVQSVLEPAVAGGPVPPFDGFVAVQNLRLAGVNGKPEILAGGNTGGGGGSGFIGQILANLTSTLATRMLNWREIPTVE
jgi:type IV pilus assembly protein PilY1